MESYQIFRVIRVMFCVYGYGCMCAAWDSCPVGSGRVKNETGCQLCLCCRFALSDKYLVRCDGRNLATFPEVPPQVTHLWLFGNQIEVLHRTPRLEKLRYLKLSSCVASESSDSVHWSSKVECKEPPLLLSEISLVELEALEILEAYVNVTGAGDFRSPLKRLNALHLTCHGPMPVVLQKSMFTKELDELASFGCGLHLNKETIGGVRYVRVLEVTEKSAVNLPNTHVELRINAVSASQCMSFTPPRASKLDLHCRAEVFNVTNEILQDFSGVESLNLTLAVAKPGFIKTLRLPSLTFDVLTIEMGFKDDWFYKALLFLLRKLRVNAFQATWNVRAANIFSGVEKSPMSTFEDPKPEPVRTTFRGLNFVMHERFKNIYVKLSEHQYVRDYLAIDSGSSGALTQITEFRCVSCGSFDFASQIYNLIQLRELEIRSSDVSLKFDIFLKGAVSLEKLVLSNLLNLVTWFDFENVYWNLRYLDISNNVAHVNDDKHINMSNFGNLRYLNMDGTFINRSICSPTFAENTEEKCITLSELDKLEVLSFADNNMEFSGPSIDIFSGLRSLKVLQMSGNNLGNLKAHEQSDLLSHVTKKLRYLDLSANKLHSIPTVIPQMTMLQVFLLNANSILQISAGTLPVSPYLMTLDIAGNHMQIFDPADLVGKRFFTRLNITENSFQCVCGTRDLRNWIQNESNTVTIEGTEQACYNDRLQTVANFQTRWIDCDDHLIAILSGVTLLSIVLLIGFLYMVYRFRYDLAYIIFRRARLAKIYKACNDVAYEYDAFLSFSGLDLKIAKKIHAELEDKQELSVAFHPRDFLACGFISDFINNKCGKIVFLVSRAYLAGEWTTFELKLAEFRFLSERSNVLVPVFLETIPRGELPPSLQALVRHITYLDWPGEETRKLGVFYKRLKMSVGYQKSKTPINSSFVVCK